MGYGIDAIMFFDSPEIKTIAINGMEITALCQIYYKCNHSDQMFFGRKLYR